MLKLMNSAMMPQEGWYRCLKIDEEEARDLIRLFKFKDEKIESYVGYPQTAEYMEKVLGIPVPVNRTETRLEDRDKIIVCKLKYRMQNPADKGNAVNADDFEWYYVEYFQFQ